MFSLLNLSIKNLVMKNTIYILLVTALVFSSCNKLVEGINVNPDLPSDASADLILTGLQVGAMTFHEGDLARKAGLWSGYYKGTDRQYYGFYNYFILNSDFNGAWADVYTNVMRNTVVLDEKLKEENREGILVGINKVMAAHTMGMATALWGDMPYSEAGDFVKNPSPKYDSQLDIYTQIQEKLNEAIEDLASPLGRPIANSDIFFNGDPDAWTKVAYSLKARFYMHTREYQKAYDNAKNGIDSDVYTWKTYHEADIDAQNLFYQFYNGNRADELQVNDTSFYNLMSSGSEIYRGDGKTDETARFRYLAAPRSSSQHLLNTRYGAAFSKTCPFPIFSQEENLLILAEASLRIAGFEEGLLYLNTLKSYLNAGHHIETGYESDSYKYEPYEPSDFATGGIAAIEGLDRTQSLLREILEEKYVSLFAQLETFNDIRRTIAEPFGLPINPNVGDQFPQRFIYPQTEIDRNLNIPASIPNIYEKTPVNR